MRHNRDSVMAMLEAFVYDPLISWRLLGGAAQENEDRGAELMNPAALSDAVLRSLTDMSLNDHAPGDVS